MTLCRGNTVATRHGVVGTASRYQAGTGLGDPSACSWVYRVSCVASVPASELETSGRRRRRYQRSATDSFSLTASLDWRTRIVTGTTQPLPTHVTISDAETAGRLCGGHWTARLTEARRRLTMVRNAFPRADHARVIRGAESLSEVDFQLLLDAARWFTVNTATGVTPRQVPLPGFHSKWLNKNQALIRALSGREISTEIVEGQRVGADSARFPGIGSRCGGQAGGT
jgi:hypothetical protein